MTERESTWGGSAQAGSEELVKGLNRDRGSLDLEIWRGDRGRRRRT